ncbi:MAG TPA: DUF4835 family protein [Crocinitomix sp.]|nr:DUF4835 family protein [Crocinitomix sp.]
MNRLIVLLFCLIAFNTLKSQELNCQVSVISDPKLQLSANDIEVLEDMENNIYEFMNTTRWTKDVFEIEERINCTVLITISQKNNDNLTGRIQVQSTRPVFNSSYNTTVFNTIDNDFNVTYLRNTTLLFSIEQYRSNLTSILGFYAYMILGYDYDSFSLEGGTKYFEYAQNIANLAKNSGDPGWASSAGKRRNRYWLVDNALQALFNPLRNAYYTYHRLGMDAMYNNVVEARKKIIDALKYVDKVQRVRPGNFNVQVFMNAKSDELISIFSQAEMKEKNTVVNILKRLDPAGSSKYQEILK